MYIDPGRAGQLLEVGTVEWHDDVAIVDELIARADDLADDGNATRTRCRPDRHHSAGGTSAGRPRSPSIASSTFLCYCPQPSEHTHDG